MLLLSGPLVDDREAAKAQQAFIPFLGKGWQAEGISLQNTIDVTMEFAVFLCPSCSHKVNRENLQLKTTLNLFLDLNHGR